MVSGVSVVLFQPSFNVLSSYFYVSLNLTAPNLGEFHDTAPLKYMWYTAVWRGKPSLIKGPPLSRKCLKKEMVIQENMVIIALTASSFLHFWVKSSTRSVPEANCLIWSVTVGGKADGIGNFHKILLNLYKPGKQMPDPTEEISFA